MRRTGRAFTLLELLLAIAVTSVLAATVYASLMVATRTRAKALESVGQGRSLGLAFDLIRMDLESAMPPTGTLAGALIGEDDGRVDTVTFTTANAQLPTDDRLSDLINVRLGLLEDTDNEASLMLVREVTVNLLSPTTQEPRVQVLARGLSGWDVSYSDGSDWLDDWDSTQHEDTLPLAVKVTLYRAEPVLASSLSVGEASVSVIVLLPAGERGEGLFSGGAG